MIDTGVTPIQLLEDYFSKFSLEDLLALKAIMRKYLVACLGRDSDRAFFTIARPLTRRLRR